MMQTIDEIGKKVSDIRFETLETYIRLFLEFSKIPIEQLELVQEQQYDENQTLKIISYLRKRK